MNAKEISMQKFDKSAFGYKTDEVDAYLNEVAALVNELTAQNADLQNKLEILASKLEEYRQDEVSMKEALVGAQKLGNSIVKEAREKAEEIVTEAQAKGDTIIREATENSQKALTSMKQEIEKEQHNLLMTQREVSSFKAKLLALYKSHLDTITSIPELKEKEEDAIESISSKLSEVPAEEEEVIVVEAQESTVEETIDLSSSGEKAEEPAPAQPFVNPFVSEERRANMEAKFSDLRFGRNAKK